MIKRGDGTSCTHVCTQGDILVQKIDGHHDHLFFALKKSYFDFSPSSSGFIFVFLIIIIKAFFNVFFTTEDG